MDVPLVRVVTNLCYPLLANRVGALSDRIGAPLIPVKYVGADLRPVASGRRAAPSFT